MWKKLLNSFEQQQEDDPLFGMVELQANDQDKTYYLMKDVNLGEQEDTISLTVESKEKKASKTQHDLFVLIEQNFAAITSSAFSYMQSRMENKSLDDLKNDFQIESVYIAEPSQKDKWELTLMNLGEGISYCVIDFEKLIPTGLTIEE